MKRILAYSASITTDGSGDATVYAGHDKLHGRIHAIKYEPGSSGLDTGADLTITGETSGVAILTKANAGTSTVWFFPVAAAHKVADGAASTLTEKDVCVFGERIKVVVAQGGATKTGTITFYVEEEM